MGPHSIKNLVCGVVATTAVVLSYAHIGQSDPRDINKNHKISDDLNYLPEDYDNNPYYRLRSEENRVSDQINIIHGLVSNLIEDSEDLDPLFSDTVSKHFWDLA